MPIFFAQFFYCRAWCRLTILHCYEHLHFTLLSYNWTAVIVCFIVIRYDFLCIFLLPLNSIVLLPLNSIVQRRDLQVSHCIAIVLLSRHNPHCTEHSLLFSRHPTPINPIPLPLISTPHLRSHTTTHTQQLTHHSFKLNKFNPLQFKLSARIRSSSSTCLPSKASSPLRLSLLSPAQLMDIWSWLRLHHMAIPATALSRPTVQTSHANPRATLAEQSQTWLSAPHRNSLSQAGLPMAVGHARSHLPPTTPQRRAPNGWSFTRLREAARLRTRQETWAITQMLLTQIPIPSPFLKA